MQFKFLAALFSLARLVPITSFRMLYPFLAVFARSLGVGVTEISAAITTRESLGVATPFLSILSDRFGRKVGMLVGFSLFLGSSLLVALWPGYFTFFASVSLTMVGMHLVLPSMHAFMGDRIPFAYRGRMVALVETSFSLSAVVGVPLVGLLIAHFGWVAPYYAFSGFGLVLFLLLIRFVPQDRREDNQSSIAADMMSRIRLVVSSSSSRSALCVHFLYSVSKTTLIMMYGVWLEDSFGLNIAALGGSAALIGIADLSGELLNGWIADRLGKKRSIFIGILLNALVAMTLPWVGGSLWGALIVLSFHSMTAEFALMSIVTVMTEVIPTARATMMGTSMAVSSLGRMLGTVLAPLLFVIGFHANAIAAVVFDVLLLVVLSRLTLVSQSP